VKLLYSLGFLLALTSLGAAPAVPKRVLIVHSFGNAAPPFTIHSIAFETELTERLGEKVDLDEVHLDHARFAGTDMEESLVVYLQKRQAQWQPDLVVPIGSPAGVFVEKYRQRLFPQTPILYAGMDRRRLQPDALQHNAAFVGESFDGPGFIEDILQLAPDTTNIVCVIGASQVERYWTSALQTDFARFTNRVSFTWLNDRSLDQMLYRVHNLPPHSFIFLILLMRDAAGVTHNADEALRRISEVANAPINSIFEHQLGLGIVGGRLYRAEAEGIEAARLATLILHGEAPSNLPPVTVRPIGSRYDWRQLRRWNLPRNTLPADSVILFREPTTWERYKGRLIGIASFVLLQSILILLLLRNLLRRRRVERALRESEARLSLAAAAGDVGIWMWDIRADRVWATDNWLWMFGFTRDTTIRYATFLERVHEKDRQAVELAVQHALNDHQDYVSEHRVRTPDGTERWVTSHSRLYAGADGTQSRLLGASVDITARKRAEEATRDLSGRLLHAQEEERARIAKELHDGLSQNLALLAVELQMFGQQLPEAAGQINDRLEQFSQQTKALSTEVHRISHGLHPAKLKQLGLAVALKGLCREVEAAHGISLSFQGPDAPCDLPEDVALCLYRVAQEAVQNIIKHSGATKAAVRLAVADDTTTLTITDNGKGFAPEAEPAKASLGLVSMRERVRSVQGEISVTSNVGKGTSIVVGVPLPKEATV
jgi:PAS domain S-box-containing protein